MNLLVLTFWSYKDALIQTYTLPYLRIIQEQLPKGSEIFLFTLEQSAHEVSDAEKESISKNLLEQGIVWLPTKYYSFGIISMLTMAFSILRLWTLCFNVKIDYIHAWCTPAGAIGYLLSRLSGKPLILDSFEPHAEPMVESGTWRRKSLAFKLLFRLEKMQLKRAAKVIACVPNMNEYAARKYGVFKEMLWKPACVDLGLFHPNKRKNPVLLSQLELTDKIVMVYAGKFGGSYLEYEFFDLVKTAFNKWGNSFRLLLLSNISEDQLSDYLSNAQIPFDVVIKKFVPHQEVPDYMGLGDFGIVPFKPVPSKRYGSPIKTSEYLAMGLPIIITEGISIDSELIELEGIGFVLRGYSSEHFVLALNKIESLMESDDINMEIRSLAELQRSFLEALEVYQEVYA